MDVAAIRRESLDEARRLGYDVTPSLPLADFDVRLRCLDDVLRRCLARYVAVAVAYGFDRPAAWEWIEQHGLVNAVAASELRVIQTSGGEGLKTGVESLWALCWSLGMLDKLDFGELCGDELIARFPDLARGEGPAEFVGKASLRSPDELVASLDLAYCLHWSIKQSALAGENAPGRVPSYVVTERRRALEWLVSDESWDAVSLDT